jgi:benzoyl-CoA reductase/2-hydroxyglutaryl-CoA dehydratase subunit BcrC/BadD/HgdB
MDLIQWFGNTVMGFCKQDPEKARRFLLTGYRANLLSLITHLPPSAMTKANRYAAIHIMETIIRSLTRPKTCAMVSLFVPCEMLYSIGLAPYSLEAISGYIMGVSCEDACQQKASEAGFSDTMCAYHMTYLGAAELGLMPPPRFIIYSNLACDGNMITFPYLRDKHNVPSFYLDIPYEKSDDSVRYVASQLQVMQDFIEQMVGKHIPEERLHKAVRNSIAAKKDALATASYRKSHFLPTDMTNEMYSAFMSHILLGSDTAAKYFSLLREENQKAPFGKAKRLLWLHTIPYMQPSLRNLINYSKDVSIAACDLTYDSFVSDWDEDDVYRAMASRLVYSGYNGPVDDRIRYALQMANVTGADGAIIFAHWGCKVTLGASKMLKQGLEERGIPAIILDGNGASPAATGDGQIRTRMEAFLEMLEASSDDSLYL